MNQLVLKTLLHQLGIDPHVVEDGQAALDAWEGQPWDVILMDVQMPVMDGMTACTKIRQREAETGRPRTPIIALTANAMSHQVKQYLAVGMDGHVAKPIKIAALYQALSCALPAGAEEPADDQQVAWPRRPPADAGRLPRSRSIPHGAILHGGGDPEDLAETRPRRAHRRSTETGRLSIP